MIGAATIRRLVLSVAVASVCAAYSGVAAAQDVPTVFIHGLASSAGAWRDTATRLEQQLRITAYAANLEWRDWYENQGRTLQSGGAGLPASTIAVGHSNGGLVARQWSTMRYLDGLVTLGTPNHGAPLVDLARRGQGIGKHRQRDDFEVGRLVAPDQIGTWHGAAAVKPEND